MQTFNYSCCVLHTGIAKTKFLEVEQKSCKMYGIYCVQKFILRTPISVISYKIKD